jgi:hypothetical protein
MFAVIVANTVCIEQCSSRRTLWAHPVSRLKAHTPSSRIAGRSMQDSHHSHGVALSTCGGRDHLHAQLRTGSAWHPEQTRRHKLPEAWRRQAVRRCCRKWCPGGWSERAGLEPNGMPLAIPTGGAGGGAGSTQPQAPAAATDNRPRRSCGNAGTQSTACFPSTNVQILEQKPRRLRYSICLLS